jgi:hypothetical protein
MVTLTECRMTDATTWLPLSPTERRSLALYCIAKLYNGLVDPESGDPINAPDLLISTADAVWSSATATGDAMFLPGQFHTHFEPARRPEGRVYFAGEHLSYHHTWISGALQSALDTVSLMLDDDGLPPLKGPEHERGVPCWDGLPRQGGLPLIRVLGARDSESAVPKVKVTWCPTLEWREDGQRDNNPA